MYSFILMLLYNLQWVKKMPSILLTTYFFKLCNLNSLVPCNALTFTHKFAVKCAQTFPYLDKDDLKIILIKTHTECNTGAIITWGRYFCKLKLYKDIWSKRKSLKVYMQILTKLIILLPQNLCFWCMSEVIYHFLRWSSPGIIFCFWWKYIR